MAKYKQIQTYTRYVNEENFQEILHKYRQLMLKMGLSTDAVDRWVSGISWSVDDSSTVSIESNPFSYNMMLELDHTRLNVSACLIIWSEKIGTYLLEEPWIELLLMVKPEEPDDAKLENVFLKIMSTIGEIFQETGVFVTNDMQDGEPFIGFIGSREEKLWEFECAIIPFHQLLLYENVPKNYRSYSVPRGIGYLRRTV